MLDGLGVVAEFRIDGAEGLPDGRLDQRRTSGGAVEPVGDAVEQGADFKVAIRLKTGTGLAQHVVLDEVERGLGIGLLGQSVGLFRLELELRALVARTACHALNDDARRAAPLPPPLRAANTSLFRRNAF